MEQAQLFKRLHAMALDELRDFMSSDVPIDLAIFKLDLAARTRQILHSIQLEDMWQEKNDETQTSLMYVSMRLSPQTLCSCLELREEMNCLEWRLVFPKYKDLPQDQKPKTFGEFIQTLQQVDIVDINDFDTDISCEFLDKVYDFSALKNPPPRFN